MTTPEEKPDLFAVKIDLNVDGTVTGGGGKYEHFAELLAEDFSEAEAWCGAGYSLTSGSMRMRKKVLSNSVFQARVQNLKAQKRELAPLMGTPEISPEHAILKEVRWMAIQTYRRAVAADNLKAMMEMTSLMARLGQKAPAATVDAPAADSATEEMQRGPGRPPAEPPPEPGGANDFKARLAERGLAAPAAKAG